MGKITNKLWELYNEYSGLHGVLIISKEDFKREIERIEIQLSGEELTQKTGSEVKG